LSECSFFSENQLNPQDKAQALARAWCKEGKPMAVLPIFAKLQTIQTPWAKFQILFFFAVSFNL